MENVSYHQCPISFWQMQQRIYPCPRLKLLLSHELKWLNWGPVCGSVAWAFVCDQKVVGLSPASANYHTPIYSLNHQFPGHSKVTPPHQACSHPIVSNMGQSKWKNLPMGLNNILLFHSKWVFQLCSTEQWKEVKILDSAVKELSRDAMEMPFTVPVQ